MAIGFALLKVTTVPFTELRTAQTGAFLPAPVVTRPSSFGKQPMVNALTPLANPLANNF